MTTNLQAPAFELLAALKAIQAHVAIPQDQRGRDWQKEGARISALGDAAIAAAETFQIDGPNAEAYRIAAAREWCKDGLEIDDGAVVSDGEDEGAYVQAWVWVSDKEAGIEAEEDPAS